MGTVEWRPKIVQFLLNDRNHIISKSNPSSIHDINNKGTLDSGSCHPALIVFKPSLANARGTTSSSHKRVAHALCKTLPNLFMWYRWMPMNPSDLSPAPSSLHSVASNPGVPAAWQRKTHGADLCGQVPNPKMALEPKSSGPSTWDSFGPNGVYHCAPWSHFFGIHSWYLLSKPKVPKHLLIKRTEFLNPVTIWATAAEKTPAINRSSPQCSTKAPLHLQISQLKTFNQRKSGRNSHATTGQPIKQYIHYINDVWTKLDFEAMAMDYRRIIANHHYCPTTSNNTRHDNSRRPTPSELYGIHLSHRATAGAKLLLQTHLQIWNT